MGHGAGYPGQQKGCVRPAMGNRFMVWMFLCIYGRQMKRFPCSLFLKNTLPTLKPSLPLLLHFFSQVLPALSVRWMGSWSHLGEDRQQSQLAERCGAAKTFAENVSSLGEWRSSRRSVLAQP